jgi:G3E family GTPase
VPERLPVSVLTGFLGSGKTTLLARLLRHPQMGETAVIVNELGEVAIDHHLLRRVDERTIVLASGCVCCSLRGDLADELRDLLSRRTRGEIPAFRRVVVETTGVADPAPVLHTLLSEPVVQHHFEPEAIVTTVDALCAPGQLEREPEFLRQAVAADRLVITKTDVADPTRTASLAARLRQLNPTAPILEVSLGDVDPATLFGAVERDPRDLARDGAPHGADVSAFALVFDEPLDWTAFGIWLTMLLQNRGQDILRVKGLLNVGAAGPLVLNGVQHVIHPPVHLDAWPDDDRRSRMVFVARGVDRAAVEASLLAFNGAASGARAMSDASAIADAR